MYLLTQYYISPNSDRQKEIDLCLRENCKNEHIKKVYIFLEQDIDLSSFGEKIHKIVLGNRLKYSDCFDFSNKELTNNICIIANSDIYFDDSLKCLADVNFRNLFLAVSRHELEGREIIPYPSPEMSQDVWIYQTPISTDIHANFYLGKPGCESRLAYEVSKVGMEVVNPHTLIRALHVHSSNIRSYSEEDRYRGKSKYVDLMNYLPQKSTNKIYQIISRQKFNLLFCYKEIKRRIKFIFMYPKFVMPVIKQKIKKND